METEPPTTTVRSELQSIRRSMDDLPHSAEARAQRRQTRMPWIWMVVGLAIATVFAGALLTGTPPSSLATPKQSAIFSTPVPHP